MIRERVWNDGYWYERKLREYAEASESDRTAIEREVVERVAKLYERQNELTDLVNRATVIGSFLAEL